jgi:hypothetical protein
MPLCTHIKCIETRPAFNDDLIDFQCSPTFRDSYYEQGLARFPSQQPPQPQADPSAHGHNCQCEDCWQGTQQRLSQTEVGVDKKLANAWTAIRRQGRQINGLVRQLKEINRPSGGGSSGGLNLGD